MKTNDSFLFLELVEHFATFLVKIEEWVRICSEGSQSKLIPSHHLKSRKHITKLIYSLSSTVPLPWKLAKKFHSIICIQIPLPKN